MKIFRNFVLLFIVIWSLLVTGCPKSEQTVRTLREKSAEMSVYGGKLVTAFGAAYKAGEITQSQLASLNAVTGTYTTALGVYRDALAAAEATVRGNKELPPGTINKLSVILNSQVVAAFFGILEKLNVLSIVQTEAIKTIITGIRLAILAVQGVFGEVRTVMKIPEPYPA